MWQPNPLGLPAPATFIAVTASTGIALAWRRPRHAAAFAFVAFVALASADAGTAFPSLHSVLYREGGTDFLTYETFARDIFEPASPHGGEDLFYWQVGYRYILAAQRLLLGEGDLLVSASSQAAINFAVFVLVLVAFKRSAGSRVAKALVALTGVCLYLLNSAIVLSLIRLGSARRLPGRRYPPVPHCCGAARGLGRWSAERR